MPMGQFVRVWKAEERCASAGIPRLTLFFGDRSCGRIQRCGRGWGGKDAAEVEHAELDGAGRFGRCAPGDGLQR